MMKKFDLGHTNSGPESLARALVSRVLRLYFGKSSSYETIAFLKQ